MNVIRMTIFDYFKTGNQVYDTMISTVVISALGYVINYLYENKFNLNFTNLSYDDIKGYFYKKNQIP